MPILAVHMHRGRGKPQSPARQAGPTEIPDYTRLNSSFQKFRVVSIELATMWW